MSKVDFTIPLAWSVLRREIHFAKSICPAEKFPRGIGGRGVPTNMG
jgi:hypothetical protein